MPDEIVPSRVSMPENFESEVMGQLVRHGGMITNLERETESRTVISATIPKKQVADFKSWLHGYSVGQGTVSEI